MSFLLPSDMKADKVVNIVAATIECLGDGVPPPALTCPICMEPWTCSGAHRICCIPCGHVYGRLCLERWLHCSGHASAKCPLCAKQFDRKLIINIYAPENLWDGCCRLQDVKAHYQSKLDEKDLSINKELDEAKKLVVSTISYHADLTKEVGQRRAREAKFNTKMVELTSLLAKKEKAWSEEFVRMERKVKNEMATTNAHLISVKEQIKKIVEGGNVAHADLLEIVGFMEQNFPTMSPIHNPLAPSLTAAENRRQNHDGLPLDCGLCHPPHPCELVTTKRRRTDRCRPQRSGRGLMLVAPEEAGGS